MNGTSTKFKMSLPKGIIVSGVPRSGSTWVGKTIAQSENVHYLHEPMHPARNIPGSPLRDYFQFIQKDDQSELVEKLRMYISDVISFRVPGLYDVGEFMNKRKVRWLLQPISGARHRARKDIPLLKDPPALLALDWLSNEFEFPVIITVRHPAAFVGSCKVLNWRFGFATFLKQDRLMEVHLEGFRSELQEHVDEDKGLLSEAILFWRIMHHIIDGYRATHPTWQIVKHEELSLQPLEQFERIFNQLSLPFSDAVKAYIKSTTEAAEQKRLARDSKTNVTSWKSRLTAEEITEIKEGCRDVWTKFYSEEEWA